MAAQQRIVGGALLTVGIVVVLILIFLLRVKKADPEETRTELLTQVYPAYMEAERRGEYLEIRRQAQRALDLLEASERTPILKLLQASGVSGNAEANALYHLIADGVFQRNVDGMYALGQGWYDEDTHRPLAALMQAVEGVKLVPQLRQTAYKAGEMIERLRLGSGLELPLPNATVPQDDAPVLSPNPVYVNDAEAYRAFGLSPELAAKALATEGAGAPARSARLVWNNNAAREREILAEQMRAVPEEADRLASTAVELQRNARKLAGNAAAADMLATLLTRAATLLGSDLKEPLRATYMENRDKFASGEALANALHAEAEMLKAYRATVRDLGATLAKDFAQ